MDRLKRAMERARRHDGYLIAVLFLDFDHFKVINDSLGHIVGDELLKAVAQRLLDCLRTNDTVARMGGDEFTILLDNITDVSDAVDLARRIQAAVTAPFTLQGHKVYTDVSIGIALSPASPTQTYNAPEEMLRDADTAMYRAKNLGRGRYEIFDKAMHAQAMKRAQMEAELRRAIEEREFVLNFQPIIDLSTGEINGFETLVRWQHPERGTITPEEFIPLAEETGMVVQLDHWVLREACRQRRAWEEALAGGTTSDGAQLVENETPADESTQPLSISVNLSSRHFSRPDTIEIIEGVLDETGVEAGSLKIEIRENVLMDGGTSVGQTLQRLRDMGIQLSMDDFGTGYSSLSYLHRFPIHTLKIDRSFISPPGAVSNGSGGTAELSSRDISTHNLEIVRAIISLARNLKVDVVAEGVETTEQMEQLRDLDCEYGQGHFFAAPVDSAAAQKMLTRRRRW
jgi:diguanylate cyclase (GGDEF)-like protein